MGSADNLSRLLHMTTLVFSSRATSDNQALWRAAIKRDWNVVRAQGLRLPEIESDEFVLYVEALFAPIIAEQLRLGLLDIPEDWLTRLPYNLRGRDVQLTTLGQARNLVRPMFVKPPNDKSFPAQVHTSGQSLPSEFADEMPVLVADPVRWSAEFRCFCLDGRVLTISPYLRNGELASLSGFEATASELRDATSCAEKVLLCAPRETPRALVVDVGQIEDFGWAVVEANAAWGSGIYGCDPDCVLDVIRAATIQPGVSPNQSD